MKSDQPILFSTPMVRAIKDRRKTQTRRIDGGVIWPRAKPGWRLWVRERWVEHPDQGLVFAADDNIPPIGWWKPGMLMPRIHSRLTLIVKDVRIERLQDISEDDAKAEGVFPEFEVDIATFVSGRKFDAAAASTHYLGFKHIWKEINGAESWDSNPRVIAITFEPYFCNIDKLEREPA